MNAVFAIMHHPLLQKLGWTLLHSLWQGALIGLVFVVLRFALRRRPANMRYLAGCVCLLLLQAAPLLTLLLGPTPSPPIGPGASVRSPASGAAPPVLSAATLGNGAHWPLQMGTDFLARLTPSLATGWLLGVVFFSLRLTSSCWWVRNIRTRHHEPLDAAWMQTLDDLRRRLRVSRPVRLLNSAWVEVPTVIGWFRPVILLPAATLTGLTPAQVQAILAHELAHVRRLDYLVNAFQCLVETLMFYHPVAWWISRCIRDERENCCDDLVIKVCGDRLAYARALATLEGFRAELPQWAFAASGGSLLNRIRRLLGLTHDHAPATARQVGGLALLAVGLVLIFLGIRVAFGPTTYQATARISVERELSSTAGLANQREAVVGYDPHFIQTQFAVIQSQAVLGKVIDNLNLRKEWGRKYARGGDLEQAETIALLKSRMDLRPIRDTSLIEILVSSDKPDEAARIANAVAEAYYIRRLDDRRQKTMGGIRALEERWQEQEKKVSGAQKEVDRLRKELNISDATAAADGPTMLMSAETLRRIEGLRIEAQAEYVSQETLLNRLKALRPDELIQAIPTAAQDSLLASLLEQRTLAEQRLVTLKKEFGPRDLEYTKVTSQIEDLKQKIDERVKGILVGLDAKAAAVKERWQKLENDVKTATTSDIAKAEASRPYFDAKRNLEELQRFRQILNLKIASERIDIDLPKTTMVEIVDPALPAPGPVSPNLPRAVALILLGILLDIAGLLMLRAPAIPPPAPQPA